MPDEPKTLAELLGKNARRLRLECGATLDGVAYAARQYGLRWTSGKVGNLESGLVSPSFPTIYALALVFADLTGRDVTLADLLGGNQGMVGVNEVLSVPGEALTRAAEGQPVNRLTDLNVRLLRGGRAMKVIADMGGKVPGGMDRPDVDRAIAQVGVAEQRAAKDLGVDVDQLAVFCLALWGRTFAEERDDRAGKGANAQKRGQVARALKDELRQEISNAS